MTNQLQTSVRDLFDTIPHTRVPDDFQIQIAPRTDPLWVAAIGYSKNNPRNEDIRRYPMKVRLDPRSGMTRVTYEVLLRLWLWKVEQFRRAGRLTELNLWFGIAS